ncbi:MAG: DNA polymerase III subunit gamma/tau, partial [Lachnospiraceae bacterium]|nr:DNA polymerase III subunit gamma/tau [Lachnospiraceae bacterium]
MSYVALYRKFRPQTFSQVKGQDHVVLTLTNQIKNNRAGHAYLFTGTRGTGKTSVAKIFAKAVNCLHPVDGEPCNECEHCKAIMAGNFMDVVEIDAASNTGVDDIRRVIEEIQYTPAKGRYKVYIIDEAHMLSGSAANAFLKTLEEPPEYVIFILATTEPHKLPVTILSRCQRYDFKRISVDTIALNLSALLDSEGVASEEKAVKYIARAADGSMRDAISLLDKCIAFNLGEKLTYANVLSTLGTVDVETFSRLFRAISKGDVALALTTIEETIDAGKDISQFVSDFTVYIRNLLLVNVSGGLNMQIMGVGDENRALLEEDASLSEAQVLLRYIRILSELLNNIRYSAGKQILLEVAVIQMAKPQMETDIDSLTDRIRQLEEKIKDGVPA